MTIQNPLHSAGIAAQRGAAKSGTGFIRAMGTHSQMRVLPGDRTPLGRRGLSGLALPGAPMRSRAAAAGRTATVAQAVATGTEVTITVHKRVQFGETVKAVGDHPTLGSWKVEHAAQLNWGEGDNWSASIQVPAGQSLEFKLIVMGKDGQAAWEDGHNRKLQLDGGASKAKVSCTWAETGSTAVEVTDKAGADKAAPAAAVQNGNGSHKSSNGAKLESARAASPPPPPPPPPRSPSPSLPVSALSSVEDSTPAATNAWQGKTVRFMKSNEHSRDRRGAWRTEGLDGAALQIVEGDREAGSWLQKLKFLGSLLAKPSFDLPQTDVLANSAIYLSWISTGSVECIEGGGHYRPNHHAELSKLVFRTMEWVIGHGGADVGAKYAARLIEAKLPAFSEEFTASVPLTRIRDLAHRSDIPSDLKSEIKHTLQNKLHRNAGPEDLVATEQMMNKIYELRNQGRVPEGFVNDFKLFVTELKDFFGAGSMTRLLELVRPSLESSSAFIVDQFIAAKNRVDAENPSSPRLLQLLIDALHRLTTVRALLIAGLASGLRNDAPDSALVMRQRWRIAEVRTQEYAYVLLSRINNLMESRGADAFSKASDADWALPIGALVLGIRHMGLTGYASGEAVALEHELAAWQKQGKITSRENALRMKATLERTLRYTGSFSDMVLSTFSDRSRRLGHGLGVDPTTASVFAEGEVRASVAFQVSKACELLLRACRSAAGVSPWDTVVSGAAEGYLIEVDTIDPEFTSKLRDDTVLLVRRATGDEEVSTLGDKIKGIVLRRSLPHLSHLGVRARQAGMTFATIDDEREFAQRVRPLIGKRILLDFSSGRSVLRETSGSSPTPGASAPSAPRAAPAAAPAASSAGPASSSRAIAEWLEPPRGSLASVVLPLGKATQATTGAKAATCGRLAVVSANSVGAVAFRTPHGCALTYDALRATVHKNGDATVKDFSRLLQSLEAASSPNEIEGLCVKLQDVIKKLRVPNEILDAVLQEISPTAGTRLICRSSANVEDLKGMSGAGLYESIGSVEPSREPLAAAIKAVWSSLYTRRAVLSRQAAGVGQASAKMGVLVQEMAPAELSFVLHTTHPTTGSDRTVVAELAVGLGETLASGASGTPWRLEVDKDTRDVTVTSFSNLGQAFDQSGRPSSPNSFAKLQYGSRTVDYSTEALSNSEEARTVIGQRLCAVGLQLEDSFGSAQDVEGCLVAGEVVIVQSRSQF